MVLVAAFLDGIDGRLARMLKATSKFGAQMDSLADIVNFGVAPALVLYAYPARPGRIARLDRGAAVCDRVRPAARPLQRARRGPRTAGLAGRVFRRRAGAGGRRGRAVAGLSGLRRRLSPDRPLAFVAAGFTVVVAFLMVSRLPVYSGKKIRLPGDRVHAAASRRGASGAAARSYPWQTLSAAVLAYLVFLPLSARAYARRRARQETKRPSPLPCG